MSGACLTGSVEKRTMLLQVVLGFGLTIIRGQIDCETCTCCKNNVCPEDASYTCSKGCIDGYTGDKCQIRCTDNCESCHQYTSNYCAKCKYGFYNAGYGMCNQACESRCKSCISHDNCLMCNDGYYNGLINGRWTSDCSLKCPGNCNSCSSQTYCSSCKEGYYIGSSSGQFYGDCTLSCFSNCKACPSYDECTECKDGFYGRSVTDLDCSDKCYQHCKRCTSYDVCTECFNGFYGPSCQYNCSPGCKENVCNNETGKCMSGCELGYDGEWCNNCVYGFTEKNGTCTDCNDKCEVCSEKGLCIKCQDNFGGIACLTACPSTCRSCVSETVCNECIDGYFDETCSSICDTGRWGNKCSSFCPAQCLNGDCYHNNGSCKLGCEYGYKGDSCYCSIHCECDVTGNCSRCDSGYYGKYCTLKCIDVDERCAECPINYKQANQGCDRCLSGYYPVQNESVGYSTCKECQNTCLDDQCDCTNGRCLKGCVDNKWGPSCEQDCLPNCQRCNNRSKCLVCEEGKYLYDCSQTCSASCNTTDGIVICEIESGACINGCASLNIYGSHCEQNCSDTCTENICDWMTGVCVNGCVDNYWGKRCEKVCSRNCKYVTGRSKCNASNGQCLAGCIEGYFSEQCDKNCSINCLNSSCDNKGKCSYDCTGEFEDGLCLQAKLQMTEGNGRRAAIIAGSVSGALILIIIIIGIAVAIVFLKRREITDEDSNEENSTVVYCNINNREHLSHPETSEIETNQSDTAQTSNREKPHVAQTPSVTENVSNVYEKIMIRAYSREYSTLSYDTNQLDSTFGTASAVTES